MQFWGRIDDQGTVIEVIQIPDEAQIRDRFHVLLVAQLRRGTSSLKEGWLWNGKFFEEPPKE